MPLIVDLLEYVACKERSYAEVIDAWHTSCPKLPVWEEATERGLLTRARVNGHAVVQTHRGGICVSRAAPALGPALKRFPPKWIPVRRKKTRQIKNLRARIRFSEIGSRSSGGAYGTPNRKRRVPSAALHWRCNRARSRAAPSIAARNESKAALDAIVCWTLNSVVGTRLSVRSSG